jgi:glyoxylate utilization-related uncharacterized protein
VVLLIEGRFRVKLSGGTYVLRRPGDYIMWGPGIGHSWRAEEDSVVVTIRWPSRREYRLDMDLSSPRPSVEPQRSDAPSSRSPAHG